MSTNQPWNHTPAVRYRLRLVMALAFALAASAALGACGGTQPTTSSVTVTGDTIKGRVTFNQSCTSCHTPTTRRSIGPGLAGLFDPGGPELPDGIDYGGNLPNGEPITPDTVAAWIENGGQGKIGVMPPQMLPRDDINDLVAYLATIRR